MFGVLGFRGEALHSIAQLAQLEICSRPHELGAKGHQVCYGSEGEPHGQTEVAIAPGTVVTVSDLFHSWPARRQVPAPAGQIKAVAQLIAQMALCHPQVTWKVEKDNLPWLSLWPGPTAKALMPQMLRSLHDTDIKELRVEGLHGGLYVAVGLPDRCHRRRPDWVRIAINGRPVAVSEFYNAVISSFRRTLPRDRYPVCFVHLTLPSTQLDWNRHPAKSEIYVQGMAAVSDRITAAISDLLRLDNLSEAAQTHRATTMIKAAEQAGQYFASRAIAPAQTHDAEPPALKVLAQVHDMYILAEQAGGLCLIEQHIAHERVLYEQLQDRWHMVALASPLILSEMTPEQVERLIEIGLEVAAFGDRLWAVRTVPEPLSQREDCADAIRELSQGANLEAALVATACRSAIRNGTKLTLAEMQELVNQWQRTKRSRTCPHGRPICLTLKESSLAKYFRRSWMIGKSHGI